MLVYNIVVNILYKTHHLIIKIITFNYKFSILIKSMQLTKIQNSDEASPTKDGELPELKNENIIINEPIENAFSIWGRSVFAAAALSGYVIYYKNIYDGDDSAMRVWEDLYGRSLFFFVCSVVWYLIHARRN